MCDEDRNPKESLVMTVEELAALWNIARASAYRGVRSGAIPSIRIGRRYVISRAVIRRMMDATSGWAPAEG